MGVYRRESLKEDRSRLDTTSNHSLLPETITYLPCFVLFFYISCFLFLCLLCWLLLWAHSLNISVIQSSKTLHSHSTSCMNKAIHSQNLSKSCSLNFRVIFPVIYCRSLLGYSTVSTYSAWPKPNLSSHISHSSHISRSGSSIYT